MSELTGKQKKALDKKARKYKGCLIMGTTTDVNDFLDMDCSATKAAFDSSSLQAYLRPQSKSGEALEQSGEADDPIK